MASGCALILAVLLFFARPDRQSTAFVVDTLGANKAVFNLKNALALLRKRELWFFVMYIVGVACIYDVFDQQFANFSLHSLPPNNKELKYSVLSLPVVKF